MFILQIKTADRGWQNAQTIWEDECGLCYAPSPENPARFADLALAELAATDLAAECEVTAGVWDERAGVRVYSVCGALG